MLIVLILIPVIAWGVWLAAGHPGAVAPAHPPWGFLFFFPIGLLFFLLVLFLLVRLAFWGAGWGGRRWAYGRGGFAPEYYGHRSPQEIAALRYARGEISSDQYRQILRDLGEPLARSP